MAQCVGSLIVCAATFVSAMAMFAALNAVGLLRVSKEGELKGLDIDQHGISAYPEYVISTGRRRRRLEWSQPCRQRRLPPSCQLAIDPFRR